MANNNTAIIAIGMVLIVALVMYGPVSQGFGNFINNAMKNWQDLLNMGGEGLQTGMEVTLTYADGTTKTIKGDSQNMLFPITIFDGGIPVSQIQVNIFGTLTYEGTLTNWAFDGDFNVRLHQKINERYLMLSLMHTETLDDLTGITWTNGETKTLKTFTLTDTEIENHIESLGKPVGAYKLQYSLPVDSFTVTFDDGNTDVIDPPTVKTEWLFTFDHSSGLTSLTLRISTEP